MKYNVFHDAAKVICNKNLKRHRKFGHIGSLTDMGTEIILAKIVKLRKFFRRYASYMTAI